MPERFPYNKEGAFFVYDRIMNLLKHFSKGLDSTGKLAIMVLALRNKECETNKANAKRRQAL